MKPYKVEFVRVEKKYASIIVDAENKRKAIEKARSIEWEEFEETETGLHTSWEVKGQWCFFKSIIGLFK